MSHFVIIAKVSLGILNIIKDMTMHTRWENFPSHTRYYIKHICKGVFGITCLLFADISRRGVARALLRDEILPFRAGFASNEFLIRKIADSHAV